MRAIEFIVEYRGKDSGRAEPIDTSRANELPGVFVQHQLRNTDAYMQYRYGMAVAAARAHAAGEVEFSQESAWAENLTQIMYAPEDEETIRLASKLMGVTPTRITDNASHEAVNTLTTSPVASSKRNRYGI